MLRALLSLVVVCLTGSVAAQRPLGPLALIDGAGPAAVVLDRYDDPPPARYTAVFIDTRSDALSAERVGAAVDRLLGRSIARKPLPADFVVQFGGVRETFEAQLRQRLRRPGANWNPATGRPRKGEYYPVVQASLASVMADSPIAAAFRRHGYALRLDGIARVTEDPAAGRVPAHVDEMHVTAHKETR